MKHPAFLPEERAELARRLREGMSKASSSEEAQAAAIDISMSYALEVALAYTNERVGVLRKEAEAQRAELRALASDEVVKAAERYMLPELDSLRERVEELERQEPAKRVRAV